MSKVGLWDLIYVQKGTEKRLSYENKIKSKHIDFVLCEPEELKPLIAIELDDRSHQRQVRQKSDDFKNKSLEAAGLPLLRIPVQSSYNVKNITEQILNILKGH